MKEQQKPIEAPIKRPRGRPFGSTNQPKQRTAIPPAPVIHPEMPEIPKPVQPPKPEVIVPPEPPIEATAPISEEAHEPELIDSIEFQNGKNNLTIRLSKQHNRMYRIQVFLNGKTEIRPSTYAGHSPGMSFWNLLKGSLR